MFHAFNREKDKIAVIGLGCVGLPLAVHFSEVVRVIGFDLNAAKIESYKQGIDVTNEVGGDALRRCKALFTSDETDIKGADYFIVAVPTPVNQDKTPNLNAVSDVSGTVGRLLKKGSVVVYESTVYPGVTEDVCVPILEKESGLKQGIDFKVGYSPERINPGDRQNNLRSIKKIVSGMDGEALEMIASLYETIIDAGVYRASSVKVAEAAKVVENSQRDINIAFMNEIAMVLAEIDVSTKDVMDAMAAKWNASNFSPGLVGGHCISVDPYYFIYKAEALGYHSRIVMSARQINDNMATFAAQRSLRFPAGLDKPVKAASVVILGVAYKEDCSDIRNSKAVDLADYLKNNYVNVRFADYLANPAETEREYGITLENLDELRDVDLLIIAAPHKRYLRMGADDYRRIMGEPPGGKMVFDIKNKLDKSLITSCGYKYLGL